MRRPRVAAAIHPLLFAAYAVLFLYAENIDLVRASEVGPPVLLAVAGAAVVMLVFWPLLGDLRRSALVASGAVIWFFGYGHLAGMSDPDVPGWELMVAWGFFLFGLVGLLMLLRSWLPAITTGLNVVGAVLLLFSLSTIIPYNLQAPVRAGAPPGPTGLEATRRTQRDIYYLIFDRYGSESALAAGFGITDNDIPAWLEQRGFYVARESQANYSRTVLSVASLLNMDHIDDLAASMHPRSEDYGPAIEMIQDHLVGRFLREQGYRYLHIGTWFGPTRSVRIADENLAAGTTTEFQAVLEETTVVPQLKTLLPEEEPMPPHDKSQFENALFQFRALHRVIDEPGPKFVVAPIALPHDPYTFDAEGNYLPPEERKKMSRAEQYRGQLLYANSEMKRLVDHLLARPPEQQPIIIIQSDEGPFPDRYNADENGFRWDGATTEELVTKFGILNAYYLPPERGQLADAPAPYPTMSSVNTFRVVLGRYFGVPLPFLPDRSYVSFSPRYPYDLTDVTDRLSGGGP